jgi:DNA-binding response OmpR family regulator
MNKKIVLIEDDEDIRNIVTGVLEERGYDVFGLSTITTLELLLGLKADCFIIDEKLPHISGHIICILLKSKPETVSIPVILMSGMDELESRAELCNAEAFIKKPFVIDELIEKVDLSIRGMVSKSA